MIQNGKNVSSEQRGALERVVAMHPEVNVNAALRRVRQYRHSVPFAVVKVSGEYLVEERIQKSAQIYADLSLLFPTILVHGSGELLSARLGHTNKHRGIRVTKPEEVPIVLEVAKELTGDLVQRINACNGRAETVIPAPANPIFNFDWLEHISDDKGELVYVGEVGFAPVGEEKRCMKEEDANSLKVIVRGGRMPVVSPIVYHSLGPMFGRPYEGYKPLNPDADDIARVVTRFTMPEWFIFVTENAANLSIDLEKAKAYIGKQRALELVKELFPRSAKLKEQYRNADWKVEAAVAMSMNGHNVAVVKQQNLLPFLLSNSKRYEQYSSAVLNASFGEQLRKAQLRRAQEVRELEKTYPSTRH